MPQPAFLYCQKLRFKKINRDITDNFNKVMNGPDKLNDFLSIFEDRVKAYRTVLRITSEFGLFNDFKNSLDILCNRLEHSANPDMAFSYFYDFLKVSTARSMIFELIRSYDTAGKIVFGVFSQSNTLSMTLIKHPEYFSWLMENDTLSLQKHFSLYEREIENLLRNAKDYEHKKYLLRRYRKKEYLRIGTKEILGTTDFIIVMKELSELADALITASVEIAYEKLRKIETDADLNFCVIALGKLGTGELNFSSDVDLVFVHGDDKKKAYYHKLAIEIISIIGEKNPEGFLYRVDMRLRPGGRNASISLGVEGYKNYYISFGQLWEQMALLKARAVAGNIKLGEQLLNEIAPFIYKRSIDSSYIDQIRRLLFKIRKHLRKTGSEFIDEEKIDVKKGTGGIREIEFIVNYFQLIYGADNALHNTSTVKALLTLKSKGYMRGENADLLIEAYLFLRKIEHKIQLLNELQTQKLPQNSSELMHFAKSLHLMPEEFIKKYNRTTDAVHNLFAQIFIESADIPVFGFTLELEDVLKEKGMKDPFHSANLISKVAQKWAAAGFDKSRINRLLNYALKFFNNESLLMRALVGFDKINPSYILSLYEKRYIFDILLKLFSVGYADLIYKNRALMEEFFLIDNPVKIGEISKTEKLRLEFAITLKILAGKFDLALFATLTEFADRFIVKAIHNCRLNNIAVIGYGKLGIGELFIGSDLDLVFISSNPYDAAKQAEGIRMLIKELKNDFEVDLRLRPFGDQAPLLINISYLDDYFSRFARTWELLACQKARVVYSDFPSKDIVKLYEKQLSREISRIRVLKLKRKIEKEKQNTFDIKSCAGGLMDIEFIAQYLCIKNRCAQLGKSTLKLLKIVADRKLLKSDETKMLENAYLFYSQIVSMIRIVKQYSVINYKNYDILMFVFGDSHIEEKINHYKTAVAGLFKKIFSA